MISDSFKGLKTSWKGPGLNNHPPDSSWTPPEPVALRGLKSQPLVEVRGRNLRRFIFFRWGSGCNWAKCRSCCSGRWFFVMFLWCHFQDVLWCICGVICVTFFSASPKKARGRWMKLSNLRHWSREASNIFLHNIMIHYIEFLYIIICIYIYILYIYMFMTPISPYISVNAIITIYTYLLKCIYIYM